MKKKLVVKPYNFYWYLYLVVSALLLVFLKLIFKNSEEKEILTFLAIFNVIEFIWLRTYKFSLRFVKGYSYNPLNELPCYLCNIATGLSFIASITGHQGCMAYVASVGFAGAVLAYMMPDPDFKQVDLISIKSFGFYGYHGLLIVSCLSFIVLGLHTPSWKYIPQVVVIGIICLLIAHITNYILRKGPHKEANYAFTYEPGTNGILCKMYKLIPVRFFYLIPFFIPFICGYIIEIIIFIFIK